ncbi:MAG: NADH-quinone oxidoreductase subunit J [Bacillales bacterium]
MTGEFIAFMVLALVAIMGGVLLLNFKNIIHSVVALVFTFLSLAGIYVLLSAEFVAVVQVLVYAGSITIILLFGIMMTKHKATHTEPKSTWKKILALLGVLGFAAAFYLGIYNLDFGAEQVPLHANNTEQIGIALYSKYIIPFELTSVVLLVALIGAIVLARKDDNKEADDK